MTGDWDFSGIVIPNAALDLYCTAGISVYTLRKKQCPSATSHQAMTVLQLRLRATLEMTMRRAKRCQNSAALLIFMRRTFPVEPSEPIEPAEPLSQ